MKLFLLLVLVVVILVGLWILLSVRGRTRQPRALRERWSMHEIAKGGKVDVILLPPRGSGEEQIRLARLDPALDEFSSRLEEARSAALEKLVALNRPR